MTDLKPILALGALAALAIRAVACSAAADILPEDQGESVDRLAMNIIEDYDTQNPHDGRVSIDNEISRSEYNSSGADYVFHARTLFEVSETSGDRLVDFGELVAKLKTYDADGDKRLKGAERTKFNNELGETQDRAHDLERLLHIRKQENTPVVLPVEPDGGTGATAE